MYEKVLQATHPDMMRGVDTQSLVDLHMGAGTSNYGFICDGR